MVNFTCVSQVKGDELVQKLPPRKVLCDTLYTEQVTVAEHKEVNFWFIYLIFSLIGL